MNEGPWKCFFCGELLVSFDEARDHFGNREFGKTACEYDIKELRSMERELAKYREEDTDLHREIHRLRAEIDTQKRRAEEIGYERGLRDAQRFPETIGLCKATP